MNVIPLTFFAFLNYFLSDLSILKKESKKMHTVLVQRFYQDATIFLFSELYLGLQGPLAGLLGVLLHRDLQVEVFETLVQLVPPFSDVTHPNKYWLVTSKSYYKKFVKHRCYMTVNSGKGGG
jgi:hypothetical protein